MMICSSNAIKLLLDKLFWRKIDLYWHVTFHDTEMTEMMGDFKFYHDGTQEYD